jgi:Hsp90 protein
VQCCWWSVPAGSTAQPRVSEALCTLGRVTNAATLQIHTVPCLVWRQVKKDEYDEFFKLTFKEFLEPLATSHFNVEGTIEFRALMFVPGMAPFEQQARRSLSPRPCSALHDPR